MNRERKTIILLIFSMLNGYGWCFGQADRELGACKKHYPADFAASFNACNQMEVDFSNNSVHSRNLTWNFGDGSTGSGSLTTHIYTAEGLYTITLISQNTGGCLDSIKKQVLLKIDRWNIFRVKDTNYCRGYSLRLPGDSNASSNCWSPSKYLDSTDIYDPLCLPARSTTYTYNIVAKGTNLITNGNFNHGDSSFNSGYKYDSLINTSGYFYVTNNATSWNAAYANCQDTTLSDSAMIINGSVVPNTIVWSKTVNVLPQTNYEFSFVAGTLTQGDSVLLEGSINNGSVKAQMRLSDSLCAHKRFFTNWYSGNLASVRITIVDLNTSSLNNNFSLNNISLKPVYLKTDTFSVHLASPTPITVSNDTAVCIGDSAFLKASLQDAISYIWSPPLNLSSLTLDHIEAAPPVNTTYTVIGTDINHCPSSDSIAVMVLTRPWVSSAIDDTSVCSGSSVILQTDTAGANTLSWSPITGLDNASIASPVATPTVTTVYTCTIGNGICNARDSVTIKVLSLPAILATNDTSICKNGQVQLNASGGIAYNWDPPAGLSNPDIPNPIASVVATILYHLNVTDSNGCSGADSVLISVKPNPVFSVNPSNAGICLGDTIILHVLGGGDSYQWYPPQTVANPWSSSSAVYPITNTVYKIVVRDSICKITDSIFSTVHINPDPFVKVSKSNDANCIIGRSYLKATGGAFYKWFPEATLSSSNIYNPSATPFQTTVYHVQVTSAAGCTAEDSVEVKVITGAPDNGYLVPSAFTPNGDGLNDCFGVRPWGFVTGFDFSIYSRWGVPVFHTTDPFNCWDGKYQGKLLPSGTFVYQIRAMDGVCGIVYRKGTVVLVR